jgi:hypothetical protein
LDEPPVELDAEAILRVLNEHAVRYVVIGGIAGVLHGSGLSTLDLDVTPARNDENLQRLCAALRELEAKLRVPNGPAVPFPYEIEFVRQLDLATLRTRHGDLDLCFRPTAPGRGATFDSEQLRPSAVTVELDGPVLVASLDDVIHSKEAVGRAKDLSTLGTLYRLRELLQADDDTSGNA